jgi:hypothetical protein
VAAIALAAVFAATGGATPGTGVPRLVFPVVGPVVYRDDFGEPRGQGRHEGNDLMAARLSPAVAAEGGKIKFWTTSARAGCMLYLYGKSGTTYQYIHLNNDLTNNHDNRGKCVAGTAYAPGLKDGATVQAGQQIAFVGDSGDAVGNPHLHFEVHPKGGAAVSPYQYLRKADHLLFPVDRAANISMSAEGAITRVGTGKVTLTVSKLTVFPMQLKVTKLGRPLVLTVPATAEIDDGLSSLKSADAAALQALTGKTIVALTEPVPGTLSVALARPGAIAASRIAVSGR